MPLNTDTIAVLCSRTRITEAQVEAAVNAIFNGWSRRPFPLDDCYVLDLDVVTTFDAQACAALSGGSATDAERRAAVRAAILQAVPRMIEESDR